MAYQEASKCRSSGSRRRDLSKTSKSRYHGGGLFDIDFEGAKIAQDGLRPGKKRPKGGFRTHSYHFLPTLSSPSILSNRFLPTSYPHILPHRFLPKDSYQQIPTNRFIPTFLTDTFLPTTHSYPHVLTKKSLITDISSRL